MAWGESDGPASTTWLDRSALVERLAHATSDGGVAVIAAEAGTGKTALLRQWLARRVGNGVHVTRAGADAGLDAELTALASGHTVVVDAADRLTDEDLAVLRAVRLDHGGTLVVAGRRDPMLPGAGLELTGEDLAWSEAEVLDVLRRWGRPMSDDEATEIAWISEGWCVAVRLAAAVGPAVLRPEAATLHHQLMREAAASIRPELLAAAVELSAVDEFDADIVDAILDPPDGGAELIATLRTLRTLGLDRTDPVDVKGVTVSPRDVVAAVLPDPASIGPRMTGKTCAGVFVTGTGTDGKPRRSYLYHVVDNEQTMREYGSQCVVWQTALNPVVALELLATGAWKGTGVLGPEAFDAVPFLDLLKAPKPAGYGSPWAVEDR